MVVRCGKKHKEKETVVCTRRIRIAPRMCLSLELQMKYQPIQFSLVQETRNPP